MSELNTQDSRQTEIQKTKEKMIKDVEWDIQYHQKKLDASKLKLQILTDNK